MVRPRVYETNALRQSHYRARQANAQRDLLTRLDRLQDTVRQAAERGGPLARTLHTDNAGTLLDDLVAYFGRNGFGGCGA